MAITEHLLAAASLGFMALPVIPAIWEFYKPVDDTPLFITKGNTADFFTSSVRDNISKTATLTEVQDEMGHHSLINTQESPFKLSALLTFAKNKLNNVFCSNLMLVDTDFTGNVEANTLIFKEHKCLKARAANIYVLDSSDGIDSADSQVIALKKMKQHDVASEVYLYDTIEVKRDPSVVSYIQTNPSRSHLVLEDTFSPLAPIFHQGCIRSKKDLIIPPGSIVKGNLVSDGNIIIGVGAYIQGTVLAGGVVVVKTNAKVGHADSKSTVSGRQVYLEKYSSVSGTILSIEGIIPEEFIYVA